MLVGLPKALLHRFTASLSLSHLVRTLFSLFVAPLSVGPSVSSRELAPIARSSASCRRGLCAAAGRTGAGCGARFLSRSLPRSLALFRLASHLPTLVPLSRSSSMPALRRRPDTRAARKGAGLASPDATLESVVERKMRAKKRALKEEKPSSPTLARRTRSPSFSATLLARKRSGSGPPPPPLDLNRPLTPVRPDIDFDNNQPCTQVFLEANLVAEPIAPLYLLPDSEADLVSSVDSWNTKAILDFLQYQLCNPSAPLTCVEHARDVVVRCLPFYGPNPPSPRSYLESQGSSAAPAAMARTGSRSSCDFGISSHGRAELWLGADAP